jgi:ubiquinone/menaquinone biosynthesis C-methylase UbiE
MGLWERVFAAGYDRFMASTEHAGLHDHRRALLAQARGRVLEVGAGTGANLDVYPEAVTELVLTEPAEPMAKRLERHEGVSLVTRAPAEELPFPDDSFDTVVTTLVLCTVTDLDRSLAEIHRVLKPGGRLLFLEHIRTDDERMAKWQRRLTPLQRRFACGCHLDRPTPDRIAASPLELGEVERSRMPKAPPFVQPLAMGYATKRQVANSAAQ